MKTIKKLLVLVSLMAVTASCFAAERTMLVMLKNVKKKKHLINLKNLDVNVIIYDKAKIDADKGASLLKDLEKANVLTLTRGGRDIWVEMSQNDAFKKGVMDFLGKGGTIFCDYKTSGNSNNFMKFTKAAKLPFLDKLSLDFDNGVVTDKNSPMASVKNTYRGFGGWLVKEPLKKILVMKENPDVAMLVMQENVNKKGRIVYSQLIDFLLWVKNERYRKRREQNIKLLLDLLFNDTKK